MDFLDQLEVLIAAQGLQEDTKKEQPVPRLDGYYINGGKEEHRKLLQFQDGGRLKLLCGVDNITNALVLHHIQTLPQIWKEDEAIVEAYARFTTSHLKRGTYQVEGDAITFRVELNGPLLPGVFHQDLLLLPSSLNRFWAPPHSCVQFEQFTFVPFEGK